VTNRPLAMLAWSTLALAPAGPAIGQDSDKPDYRLTTVTRSKPAGGARGTLYRHVDANGKVVYTDRPDAAGEQGRRVAPPNVESPEARRQMNIDLQNRSREEYADRVAATRRQSAIQRRDALEAERKRSEYEKAHPGESARTIRTVP